MSLILLFVFIFMIWVTSGSPCGLWVHFGIVWGSPSAHDIGFKLWCHFGITSKTLWGHFEVSFPCDTDDTYSCLCPTRAKRKTICTIKKPRGDNTEHERNRPAHTRQPHVGITFGLWGWLWFTLAFAQSQTSPIYKSIWLLLLDYPKVALITQNITA